MRRILAIQIEAHPDGSHCGMCNHQTRPEGEQWCALFNERVDHESALYGTRVAACMAAEDDTMSREEGV